MAARGLSRPFSRPPLLPPLARIKIPIKKEDWSPSPLFMKSFLYSPHSFSLSPV